MHLLTLTCLPLSYGNRQLEAAQRQTERYHASARQASRAYRGDDDSSSFYEDY